MKNKRLFKLCGTIQIVTMLIFVIIAISVIITNSGQSVEINSIGGKLIIIDVVTAAIVYVITSFYMHKYRMWASDELDRLMERHSELLSKCKYL